MGTSNQIGIGNPQSVHPATKTPMVSTSVQLESSNDF